MTDACKSCRYFHPEVTTSRTIYQAAGECRINPPGVFAFEGACGLDDAAYRMWPIVHTTDWCGGFSQAHGGRR